MRGLELSFRIMIKLLLESIASGFTWNGQSLLTVCVSTVDAVVVRIKESACNEVLSPSTYFNRTGLFSMNVQALCDSQYQLSFFSSLLAGSTHSSTAFELIRHASVVEGSKYALPVGYYIVGHDAHPCSDKILTPWAGKNSSVWRDSFNFL